MIILAERGKDAEYTIVIPAEASPSQKYAAEELRVWTEKLAGVRLPIMTDAEPLPPRAILLGVTKYTKALLGRAFDLSKTGEDGFTLVARPPHLLVAASPARGTLYGVYEILERFGGIRWLASWHTVVPELERLEIPADLDVLDTPAFAMREPYWYDVMQHPEFAARLRVNSRSWKTFDDKYGGQPFRFGGGLPSCHTFNTLMPPDEFFDEHPEYFSLVNGKRLKHPSQLCLTNPDVLRIVTERVLGRIRKDPGAKFYGVSQNDWNNYCECPACKAVDEEEGTHAGTMVRFVNAVAEAVEKEFPDVLIETLAYQYTRRPPKKTRLRKNVVPCLCTIECDFARPLDKSRYPQNISFCEDIQGWSAQTGQLYVWDYTTNFSHYPHAMPNVLALQGNIQFFRDNKVKELFEQGGCSGRHAHLAELKAWLIAKWMWNPELPAEKLFDDFFAGYYGAAAPFVREYFGELHKIQLDRSASGEHPLTIYLPATSQDIPDEFFERAAVLWDKAAAAVKDDHVLSYNVRMGAFSNDYTRLERLRLRHCKTVWLTKEGLDGAGLRRAKELAKSELAKIGEAGDIRQTEGKARNDKLLEHWRDLSDFPEPTPDMVKTSAVIVAEQFELPRPGIWAEFADDTAAEGGKAVKLFNTHSDWCVYVFLRHIAFARNTKYRIRVHARVEAETGAKGQAFQTAVFDAETYQNRLGLCPDVTECRNGYAWYDACVWEPRLNDFFQIASGYFDAANGVKPAFRAVWIDKIEIGAAQVG